MSMPARRSSPKGQAKVTHQGQFSELERATLLSGMLEAFRMCAKLQLFQLSSLTTTQMLCNLWFNAAVV